MPFVFNPFTGNLDFIRSVAAVTIGSNIETPSGSVNASNTSFTVGSTPFYIVSDGLIYFENSGYTISGSTITMTTPPASYIRNIF